jgi:steroid delta-isomerase-like uncharacterized protein
MSDQNKALVSRVYDAFNTGNLEILDAVLGVNIVDHNPFPGQPQGVAGVKQLIMMLRTAFPDFHITVEDMVAEGDRVAVRVRTQGTHQGEFMGISATGKEVTQTGIEILRIAGGKAVERWGEFDNLGMMQQLGVIPS